jgi:hypothetical protein
VTRLALAALAVAVWLPPAGAAAQARPLVTYERTGGFIGVDDSLTVLPTGTAESSHGRFRLSAQRLAALKTALRKARFATLRARYDADAPVSDGFTYRVRHAGRTVVVEEEARVPARLARVLDLLADVFVRRA